MQCQLNTLSLAWAMLCAFVDKGSCSVAYVHTAPSGAWQCAVCTLLLPCRSLAQNMLKPVCDCSSPLQLAVELSSRLMSCRRYEVLPASNNQCCCCSEQWLFTWVTRSKVSWLCRLLSTLADACIRQWLLVVFVIAEHVEPSAYQQGVPFFKIVACGAAFGQLVIMAGSLLPTCSAQYICGAAAACWHHCAWLCPGCM